MQTDVGAKEDCACQIVPRGNHQSSTPGCMNPVDRLLDPRRLTFARAGDHPKLLKSCFSHG